MGGGIFWIVGVGGHFLWVNGGRWRYIFGEWGWVDIFYGWGGGGWRYILGGWVRVEFFMGGFG